MEHNRRKPSAIVDIIIGLLRFADKDLKISFFACGEVDDGDFIARRKVVLPVNDTFCGTSDLLKYSDVNCMQL